MSDYQDYQAFQDPSVRCPKCGFQSSNPEICDACGAVFSKIRAREIESDRFGTDMSSAVAAESFSAPAPIRRSYKAPLQLLLGLLACAALAGGLWYWYQNYTLRDVDTLVRRHDDLLTRSRLIYASKADAHSKSAALGHCLDTAMRLSGKVAEVPK